MWLKPKMFTNDKGQEGETKTCSNQRIEAKLDDRELNNFSDQNFGWKSNRKKNGST